jgi:hypothetical protein
MRFLLLGVIGRGEIEMMMLLLTFQQAMGCVFAISLFTNNRWCCGEAGRVIRSSNRERKGGIASRFVNGLAL